MDCESKSPQEDSPGAFPLVRNRTSMTRIEMIEQAIQVLGDAPAEKLAAFVQKKHGEKIEPHFIPLFLASIRDRLRRR